MVKVSRARRGTLNWVALTGTFSFTEAGVVFHPTQLGVLPEGDPLWGFGICMISTRLSEGTVRCQVSIQGDSGSCEVILYYQPENRFSVLAGLGAGTAYGIRHFDGQQWISHYAGGERQVVGAGKTYQLAASRSGNSVTLEVDDVVVGRVNLPWPLPPSQVGLWMSGESEIRVTDFRVDRETPKAFVVMQFSEPYNELYQDVIRPVCEGFDVEVERADETVGPGFIVQDVVNKIQTATFIIADITPPNPNVFFEVGYAYAVGRPTILVAEGQAQLPFDVSGFRTLFYENTIAGKSKIEDGLRRYVEAILRPHGIPRQT